MIRRALQSRAWRKFRRNRLAVAASVVIAAYVLIGAFVFFCDMLASAAERWQWAWPQRSTALTFLTLDAVEQPVGPLSMPGWLEGSDPERRYRDAELYVGEFRKALRQRDKEAALARIRYGERVAADLSVEEFDAKMKQARELIRELDAVPDLRDALPQIEQLEAIVDSMFAPLPGLKGAVQGFKLALGTDRQGRSLMTRAIYSIKVAIQVGLIVGLVSVLLGSLVGAAAAFFGGWVDHAVVWLFSTLSSVPELVLLAVLVYMFNGSVFDDASRPALALVPVYAAMIMTFWIGPCRVVRGEVMRVKQLEYVQAATALGFGRPYILLRHVLPNTLHLMFINFSLLFIAAIKFEVVLSFLGLGVKVGPSWGRMIQESTQEVINAFFWQIGAATAFMFVLVLAFNIVSDALQDAFDPKHV